MGMICRMDSTGDTVVATWDPEVEDDQDASEGTEDTEDGMMSLAEASKVFDQMVKDGHLMVQADEDTGYSGVGLKKFNPDAKRIIAMRPLVGG